METDDDACSFSSRKRPNYRWGLCLGHYISDKVPPEAFDINNDDFCPSESQLQQLGADGSTEPVQSIPYNLVLDLSSNKR